MVFLLAAGRGAAFVAGRRLHTCLCTGLHMLEKTDDIVPSSFKLFRFSLYPYVLKPGHFHTTVCESIESLQKETESAGDGEKVRESAEIFQEWGCSESDVSKIFERRSSLRKMDIHNLRSKLDILSRLGINSADLVKMIHCRPRLLNCRINIDLNERLVYLEGLFGSKEVLVKAIVRNPSLLTYDFHNKVKPVIAMYESLGLSKNDLITVLLSRPTLIPRTNLNEEKIDYIRRTGVSECSKMYKHVVSIVAISRMETIHEKMMNMEKYGLSEDDYLGLIGRSPLVLTLSVDKVQRNMTYVLGTMKLPASVVVHNPFLIFFNLERVLKPRFQIACKIEDMGLAPQIKGPLLLRAMRMSDKRFTKAFISCHPEGVARELLTAYNDAKCVRRLAESSKKNLHTGFPF
ncbi:hypothetical protein AAHA92_13762 [Salvia divinorum]|uniref:Uncharacterized protein n=1 Tax=Salvia divinorum TaxID=28513 RepID=A0ABD1H9B3_SALDI